MEKHTMSNSDQTPRTIEKVHRARRQDMQGLKTYRALPTDSLDQIDPFLLLNHHGPEEYPADNDGLPFEPHPHRGMQTVTFIVDGDIVHQDNAGFKDRIDKGGVQWMVAGSGLLHSEVSSEEFERDGGNLEILQLWINLPKADKDVDPAYFGYQDNDLPVATTDDGRVNIKIVAGSFGEHTSPMDPLTDVEMYWLDFDEQSRFDTNVDPSKNIFLYVVQGNITVNGRDVETRHLVEFGHYGDAVSISAEMPSLVLFGHATPYDEPVVSRGPFVMNTVGEIKQAYADLRAGKFGRWDAD